MPMTYDQMKFSKPQRKRAGKYQDCENCGVSFYLSPSMAVDKRRGRFCSRSCQKEFYRIEKICPNCGNTFKIPQGTADRYTHCSWECRANRLHDVVCERCNKTFKSHETRWKSRFCSEECRRPPVIIICETCGNSFRKIPSDTDRKYCSFACYRRSNGETSLERIVRQALTELNIDFVQEAKIGRYSIDFYFPGYWIALEVDGTYWHQDKKRDARKDKYLQKRGIKVVRITENEIHNLGASNAISDKLSKFLNIIQS